MMKHLLFLLIPLILTGCKNPDLELGENPWDQDSDIPVVLIDSIHIDHQGLVRINYRVDRHYLRPGVEMVYAFAYRNGELINSALVSRGYLVDPYPVSGATNQYGIEFTPSGGGRTKRFGPFEYTVP